MPSQADALAQQVRLIEALEGISANLAAYAITRPTAASQLHAALALRHSDQCLQRPPPTIHDRRGFRVGAVLERVAMDLSGTGPIDQHIPLIASLAAELRADLPKFLATHRFPQPR